jgi:hypothetical protein
MPAVVAQHFGAELGAVEDAVEVGLEDAVPLGGAHLLDGAVAEDAGVVDEDVEASGRVHDALHEGLDRLVAADVGVEDVDGDVVAAQACGHLLGVAAVDAVGVVEEVDDAGGAGGGEGLDDGRPHAARAAGDENHLVGEAVADHRNAPSRAGGFSLGRRVSALARILPGWQGVSTRVESGKGKSARAAQG